MIRRFIEVESPATVLGYSITDLKTVVESYIFFRVGYRHRYDHWCYYYWPSDPSQIHQRTGRVFGPLVFWAMDTETVGPVSSVSRQNLRVYRVREEGPIRPTVKKRLCDPLLRKPRSERKDTGWMFRTVGRPRSEVVDGEAPRKVLIKVQEVPRNSRSYVPRIGWMNKGSWVKLLLGTIVSLSLFVGTSGRCLHFRRKRGGMTLFRWQGTGVSSSVRPIVEVDGTLSWRLVPYLPGQWGMQKIPRSLK